MKDIKKTCQHTLSEDLIYKEVVVIGNGPSGMVTSYMLAGNVPYLKKVPEDLPIDEMLRARLSNLPEGQSLYETDLIELAEGLEGRSQNPIPLLMDNLLRPCADLGIQADPLIDWKYDEGKQIEHVVLGRTAPGGSWQTFPRTVRTLSPAAWLALPPHASAAPGDARLSARAVAVYCRRYVHACRLQRYFRCNVIVNSVTLAPAPTERCPAPRCPLSAKYVVSGYDKTTGRGFRYVCDRVVVACGAGDRPNTLPSPAPPGAPSPRGAASPRGAPSPRGAASPRGPYAKHAHHTLASLERAVNELATNVGGVLVVGSGVSAADAVRAARRRALPVLHLHAAPADTLARLSPRTYPDYCQVYKMMCDGPSGNHENYTPYPNHVIVDITPHTPPAPQTSPKLQDHIDTVQLKKVKLLNLHTNETTEVIVSTIGVFIGSKPDLFFLQTNFDLNCIDLKSCNCSSKKIEEKPFFKNHWMYFKTVLQSIQNCKSRYFFPDKCNCEEECKCDIISYTEGDEKIKCQCEPVSPLSNGIGFGVDRTKPVDSRNPIAVDKSTHELLNAPKGMYALGPLTADNFVRFIPGGALALVSHIHRDKERLAID